MEKNEMKRITVTLLPEWKEPLSKLKREKFYDKPKAELIRYLLKLGLESANKNYLLKQWE